MRISSFIMERRAENRRAGPVGALHRRQCGVFQGGKIAPVDLGAGKQRRLPVEYKPTPAARPNRKGRDWPAPFLLSLALRITRPPRGRSSTTFPIFLRHPFYLRRRRCLPSCESRTDLTPFVWCSFP